MRIEGGSQNATRIPGYYAYPVQRYNDRPVEGVDAIRGGDGERLRARLRQEADPRPEDATISRNLRTQAEEYRNGTRQGRSGGDSSAFDYANAVFSNQGARSSRGASTGLFLNLLG